MRHAKLNGKNPCKTRPGEVRTVPYHADYSSGEAAEFANVPPATVYRAMREGHLPITELTPGRRRIAHADLLAWMETRGFPVPHAQRGTAPIHLAIPIASQAPHQQRTQRPERREPIPDVALEPADMDVPAARLTTSGYCDSYHADTDGWLANTDDAIEEATVSLAITTVEMRALAAVLLVMADELETPVVVPSPTHTPLAGPLETVDAKLLELNEAAGRYNLPESMLRREIKAGRLPAYKIGKRYRLNVADITKWLRTQQVRI